MSDKNYRVQYEIDVQLSKGAQELEKFASSVEKISKARDNYSLAIKGVNSFIKGLDKTFNVNGKKRDFNYKLKFDTQSTENKLAEVKSQLTEIQTLAEKTLTVNLNPVQKLDAKAVKATAQKVLTNKTTDAKLAAEKTLANNSIAHVRKAQKEITSSIGKINAAMVHLERGREVNIKTDKAKERLKEILRLINRIKREATLLAPLNFAGGTPKGNMMNRVPYAPTLMSEKARNSASDKLLTRQLLFDQKLSHQKELEAEKAASKNAAATVRQQQNNLSNQQRAAINRLQYMKKPTLRNIPLGYMLNGYMAFSMMKQEVTKAVEYSNIMQTAHAILKTSDKDLGTFETRFDRMAKYVRQIGVETKFTAVEVAGAVKYLSMAGMDIDRISNSIRAITNLALIGDNDIAYIADLATNIMAGYDIESASMNNVADIIASTVSRSNVNIVEMAESYKMAAGYMRMAKIDFAESAAAIGVLGNSGVKATMAGTTLRAMATRFAKPTSEARKTMERLGVSFTYMDNEFGKKVEKLKSLHEIFTDLNKAGASLEDMQTIFGRIGGNGAMILLNNLDMLEQLTASNQISYGVSDVLGKVKQDTTKGLWFQMTSQFSESFMQAYEVIEPQIRRVIRSFLDNFKPAEFAEGIAALARVMLDLVSVIGNVARIIVTNFHWIEPLVFTGVAAKTIFKLAGAVSNLGMALGVIGKKSAIQAGVAAISTVAGTKATTTVAKGAGAAVTSSLFASQVATGNGVVGAGASLAALGSGVAALTGILSVYAGALGWVAYKMWKVKEAKDAITEEIENKKKYRYPSIEALQSSIADTFELLNKTKSSLEELTNEQTLREFNGYKAGRFTNKWKLAFVSLLANLRPNADTSDKYDFEKAFQDDVKDQLINLAESDGQQTLNSIYGELSKMTDASMVKGFRDNIRKMYQIDGYDDTIFRRDENGNILYNDNIDSLPLSSLKKAPHYADYYNETFLGKMETAAEAYALALSNPGDFLKDSGFDFTKLREAGFFKNKKGEWVQKELDENTPESVREEQAKNFFAMKSYISNFASSLRAQFGDNPMIAKNILEKEGFTAKLWSNEPNYNSLPYNSNPITSDDDGAGGNYSGTGKLSGSAPRQVLVNIDKLMSIETIQLLKSENGQQEEIQHIKEQLAQALIDVVHDFDASWNG